MCELQSKFIEGTDEKYSIREDGAVFRHRKRGLVQIALTLGKSVKLCVNGKKKTYSIHKLMIQHYGYVICKKCKTYIYDVSPDALKSKTHCDACIIEVQRRTCREWKRRNPEKQRKTASNYKAKYYSRYLEGRKKSNKIVRSTLTKAYVACCLKIPVSELTDELYEHQKQLILFKRKAAAELNVNIQKLV